jgi:hypothetical protein
LNERLQLMAAGLERRPIVIMPHKCNIVEEWLEQYGLRRHQVGFTQAESRHNPL